MNFTERLRRYLIDATEVLRGEAAAAKVFPNTSDHGQAKERAFLELLRLHLPSQCNIFLGGYLFDLEGEESKQLDVIVADSQSLTFNLHNRDGGGKAFGCVDGSVCAVSLKSMLDKQDILDALANIASIPLGTALGPSNSDPLVNFEGMRDGLLKVILAFDGPRPETLFGHLRTFYAENPGIPNERRPNYIHVLGKYTLVRAIRPLTNDEGHPVVPGQFLTREHDADLFFLSSLLTSIERISRLQRHIFYDYTAIFERAVPPNPTAAVPETKRRTT